MDTLLIILVGIAVMMGDVSWGTAIVVAVGVATAFGAPSISTTNP